LSVWNRSSERTKTANNIDDSIVYRPQVKYIYRRAYINTFSFELGTSVVKFERLRIQRFLEQNRLFQNSEVFFSLSALYFQEELAIIFDFNDFQVTFSLASIRVLMIVSYNYPEAPVFLVIEL
jgi:hypothetical protein